MLHVRAVLAGRPYQMPSHIANVLSERSSTAACLACAWRHLLERGPTILKPCRMIRHTLSSNLLCTTPATCGILAFICEKGGGHSRGSKFVLLVGLSCSFHCEQLRLVRVGCSQLKKSPLRELQNFEQPQDDVAATKIPFEIRGDVVACKYWLGLISILGEFNIESSKEALSKRHGPMLSTNKLES